jgi:hypothetical protein
LVSLSTEALLRHVPAAYAGHRPSGGKRPTTISWHHGISLHRKTKQAGTEPCQREPKTYINGNNDYGMPNGLAFN